MSVGFTPGPWSVGPAHVVAQRSTDTEGRRTTRFVAEAILSAPLIEGEREANARLIAAAPELYEALDAAKFWIGMQDRQSAELSLVIDRALAKARGER